MALTILTAGLAACGLLLLLWSVAEAMLLPLPREDAVLVAPLQGGAAEVERQIRGCRWMREHRGLRAQIIWIDRGLTPEGQEAAARLLRDAAAVRQLSHCDAVLLVEACGRSAYTAVSRAQQMIQDAGKPLAGYLVLEDVK